MIRRRPGAGYAPDTRPRDDWRHHAACRNEDPELFFPPGDSGPHLLQIQEAKEVCASCPVMDQCLTWALESGQDAGVWGGLSENERRAMKRRAARQRELVRCGTTAAYRRHQRNGEEPCTPCRSANARALADREAKRKANMAADRRPPTITDKCGTTTGYRRHHQVGEEPCTPCRAANTEANRRQRRRLMTGKTA